MAWWHQKIVALLHDPPDKALRIPGHKQRAGALVQTALRGLPDVPPTGVPPAEWEQAAKQADIVAAAAERLNFPEGLRAPGDRFLHPLSAQERLLAEVSGIQMEKVSNAQAGAVGDLGQLTHEPQTRFLILWHCLEEELVRRTPEVPWDLLPADTRIPDHPLLSHARVASAFANCLPHPATLLFSIGPVQGFIATARKTRDLWVGSFLLSYLIWHGIQVVAERLGPDHVLFPSLLGQPLVDRWLHKKSVPVSEPPPDQLRLATLPNRFFAIVPAKQAEYLAERAEEALQQEWQRLANNVWNHLCSKVPEFEKAKTIWDRQLKQFPEVYWVVYPWQETAKEIAELFEQLTGDGRWITWLKEMKGTYEHNQGSVYAACYELTERALGARKASRLFHEHAEPAGKCSVCGERQALSDLGDQVAPDWSHGEKEFWREAAEAFPGDVDADGRERLCAICTIKRFTPKAVFEKELGISPRIPSTDSIAAATFVEALLERWPEVRSHVQELLAVVGAREPWQTVAFVGIGIPRLEDKAGSEAKKLMELDGEWLFAESYALDRIQRAHGIVVGDEDAQRCREALSELYRKIGWPNDYYAVLFMDGDQMGRWLSGTHADLPRFAELLHPQVREQLARQPDWQEVLKTTRLMSPSLHAAISQALANFALNGVPYVVEKLLAGRLVYAGGDDVLALLPLRDALSAAHKLRALFSGEAKLQADGEIFVEFGSQQWTGWLGWKGRQLLTMGNRATASIGVVVAHRLHPLRDVLRQGREAEEDAKERYGRNAICVRWLKRSGEQVQMGTQFFYPKHSIDDTLRLLLEFAQLMRTKISHGFATDWMQQASFALAGLDEQARKAELRRLLQRRKRPGADLPDGKIEDWAGRLARLAAALDAHGDPQANPFDLTCPQAGAVELGKWLTFLRFLTGGGE